MPCAWTRSRIVAANLRDKIAKRKHRLITLTLRSEQQTLASLIKQLYAAFRNLRRTTLWHTRIRGGAAFLEIKYNPKLDRWHPHLHIVAEGQYIETGHLSQEWQRITKLSSIVDVRMIDNNDKVVNYVAKYASKPLNTSYVRNHDKLCEAIAALAGTHLCMTFGCWRSWKLFAKTNDGPWHYIRSVREVIREATAGSIDALQLLEHVGLTLDEATRIKIMRSRPPPLRLQRRAVELALSGQLLLQTATDSARHFIDHS
jgi:hypothetical protein